MGNKVLCIDDDSNENIDMSNKLFDYIYGENVEKEYPELSVAIERITPSIAKQMLKANTKNRNVKRTPFVQALKNDEYIINGDTIVFGNNGRLLDGQHRLMTVIETGKTIDAFVVRGIDPKAQITMDTGSKRTLADYLKMDGYLNASIVASMGRAMMTVDRLGIDSYYQKGGNEGKATLLEQYEYTTSNYETRISPILNDVMGTAKQFKLSSGLFAPLYDIFYRINIADYQEFSDQIRGFSNQCQPVQVLYRTLINNADPSKKNKLKAKSISAYVVKTWNAYMQGEELSFLRFTLGGKYPEAFPQIYGMEEIDER